jgi:hypothetical protein
MKNAAFWDIKTQFVPRRRHVSITVPSRLMLSKISSFQDDDYEECHLLEYKTQFVSHRRHVSSLL